MYQNTVAVAVVILPVSLVSFAEGLLVIQRGNPQEDGHDLWAFPGGYVGIEDVRQAAVREVFEELQIKVNPAKLVIQDVQSVPDGTKHLIFLQAPMVLEEDLPPFIANGEVTERKIITHVTEVDWAFPLHREQAEKFFAGIDK